MRPLRLISVAAAVVMATGAVAPAATAGESSRSAARAEQERAGATSLPPPSLAGAKGEDPFARRRAAQALGAARPGSTARLVVQGGAEADLAGLAEQARRHGGAVQRLAARTRTVAVEVPSTAVGAVTRRLEALPGVVAVEPAQRYGYGYVPSDPQYASRQKTYFDAVRAEPAWDGNRGRGVRVAVLDSGVDDTHPELAGTVVGRYNAADGSATTSDAAGHGTAVASVIAAESDGVGMAGAAAEADILAVKVEDAAGNIWSDAVADGIRWAVANGAQVINLSLGSTAPDPLTSSAVAAARAAGAVVVASAGNAGTDARHYPAAYPGVVSVGATTADGSARASFSSHGSWVSVAAPGQGVLAAVPAALDPDGYAAVDGTSFSAPLVAAEAALVRGGNPALTGADVERAVLAAHDGRRLGFGRGLVDYAAATSAIPAAPPVFVAPAAGGQVSGAVSVSATSTAARVRFSLPGTSVAADAAVVDGVATAVLPTWGLTGSRSVSAVACSALLCAAQPTTLPVVVGNPVPTITAPASGAVIGTSLVVAATAPGGGVRFLVDGVSAGFAASAPYALALGTGSLTDGAHALTAVLCNSAGTLCDTAHPSAPLGFSVKRLRPTLTAGPSPFSPNGDGRRDTATLTYGLEQPQTVDLRITTSAGAVVRAGRLGTGLAAGTYRWVWNGRSSAGVLLGNGRYRVEISTSRTVAGSTVRGVVARDVVLDRTAAALSGAVASPSTVFPVPDGYRDTTRLSVTTNEGLSSLEGRVHTSTGALVRTLRLGAQPAGQRSLTWDGRSAGGAVLPAGSYTFQLVAVDLAGNRSATARVAVTVSGKRLVARTAVRSVTPYASVSQRYIGRCSAIFVPGRDDWVSSLGYYSDYSCDSTAEGEDLAAATHSFTLPAAIKYGTVRIGAYGAAATDVPEVAALVYLRPDGTSLGSSVVLGASAGTRTGPAVAASSMLSGRTLTWLAGTVDYNWYDVKSYTVTWTYYVLA